MGYSFPILPERYSTITGMLPFDLGAANINPQIMAKKVFPEH